LVIKKICLLDYSTKTTFICFYKTIRCVGDTACCRKSKLWAMFANRRYVRDSWHNVSKDYERKSEITHQNSAHKKQFDLVWCMQGD
jgi:hypothetical protein